MSPQVQSRACLRQKVIKITTISSNLVERNASL